MTPQMWCDLGAVVGVFVFVLAQLVWNGAAQCELEAIRKRLAAIERLKGGGGG